MLGLKQDQRRAVFDIFCENEKGEVFIVEMQKSRQKYFSDQGVVLRLVCHPATIHDRKGKARKEPDEVVRKRWNYQICKVYVVCILNYIMDPSRPEKYCWDVVRMDRELKLPFSETLNEIYIEMP